MTGVKRARLGRLLLAALVCTSVAACGVPGDGATRTVASDEVPYRLLARNLGAPPSSPPNGRVVTVPHVYFLDQDDRLVAQRLPVDGIGLVFVENVVLEALAAGPTEDQRGIGLGTALGPGVQLKLVDVVDGTARISVTPSTRNPAADRLPLAVGQVVLTAASIDGVDRVLLLQNGQPVEAPLPGGEQTSAALLASDYSSLLADSTSRPQKAVPTPTTLSRPPGSG